MVKQNSYKRLIDFIAGPKFFWAILALFVFQAAWIALSGRYPMAFDEDFHLGIIRLYAHHLSPFWDVQPVGADAYGAVWRDPSFLYQWLMSFPYRLINVFTRDQTIIVLWLRALNIALFAAGLAVYRRLLLKTGASRAIVHGCLLVFVLVPVVTQLAAQINYDNLFLPLVGLVLLFTASFSQELGRKKRISGAKLLSILILCLLGALIKYAFLPIFAAVVAYVLARLWQVYGSSGKIWAAKLKAAKGLATKSGLLLAAGLVITAGLFVERYGINVVRYHDPVPDCSTVLSIERCSHYGPWIRDYNLELNKDPEAPRSPLTFAADWFYGMWLRSFFAVDGPATGFQTRGPLAVPAIGAIVFAAAGIMLFAVYAKRLFKTYDAAVLALLAGVTVFYLGVLWLDGYQAFLRTGVAVAINGRYLFPVLPVIFLVIALSFNEFCGRRENLKLFIGGIAVACMLWGGGALTYILRSNPRWYWPAPAARTMNRTVQDTLGPVTPGYRHSAAFLH